MTKQKHSRDKPPENIYAAVYIYIKHVTSGMIRLQEEMYTRML